MTCHGRLFFSSLKERTPETEQKYVEDELRKAKEKNDGFGIWAIGEYQKIIPEKGALELQTVELLEKAYAANTPRSHVYLIRPALRLPAGTLVDERFEFSKQVSAQVKIEPGVLKISTAAGGLASYTVAKDLSLDTCTLTFKARQTNRDKGDHHFGVNLLGAAGRRLMIFTRGGPVSYVDGKEEKSLGNIEPPLAEDANSKWTEFQVLVDGKSVEAIFDGKRIGKISCDIAPVTAIEIYSFLVDLEVASCKLESPVKGTP